jgi:hypothetical protein
MSVTVFSGVHCTKQSIISPVAFTQQSLISKENFRRVLQNSMYRIKLCGLSKQKHLAPYKHWVSLDLTNAHSSDDLAGIYS